MIGQVVKHSVVLNIYSYDAYILLIYILLFLPVCTIRKAITSNKNIKTHTHTRRKNKKIIITKKEHLALNTLPLYEYFLQVIQSIIYSNIIFYITLRQDIFFNIYSNPSLPPFSFLFYNFLFFKYRGVFLTI